MTYKIFETKGTTLGLVDQRGQKVSFSLKSDGTVPIEFRKEDEAEISYFSRHPALLAVGVDNKDYYEITHVLTGKTLRVLHQAGRFGLEK